MSGRIGAPPFTVLELEDFHTRAMCGEALPADTVRAIVAELLEAHYGELECGDGYDDDGHCSGCTCFEDEDAPKIEVASAPATEVTP